MNPYFATLLNGIVLIVMSVWAYTGSSSFTALIPAIFGVLFLAMAPGVKKHNKAIAHIVVVLAVLLVAALIRPLMGTLERDSMIGTIRIAAMLGTTVLALVIYVKSFLDARKS